ncbi:MAG TPA: NifU family protein [Burkholderiaceae bacterium]|nr:NifU family protein [Burkholderiaceae bacterium]
MPKISDIEPTPNPNAMKFVLREPLTWGVTRSYESAEQAAGDPLASALFANPHVTSVFYVDHWLTVTQDGRADWQALLRELAAPIREAPAAQAHSEAIAQQSPAAAAAADLSDEDREKLEQIVQMLDERVRPYLQSDGGDLYVVGLNGKEVQVHYQGACGSCPSSITGTLTGIESMIRQIDPDLYVVPV